MSHDPVALLAELVRSGLLSESMPKREVRTHAERAATNARPRIDSLPRPYPPPAIERFPNWKQLKQAAYHLGQAHYEPAVPLLTRLWRECDIPPIRDEAGFALRAIGTPEARDVLRSTIGEADHRSVQLGVGVEFDEDPLTAYDRLAKYFTEEALSAPGGEVIAVATLWTFVPSRYTQAEGFTFINPRVPQWFRDDPRWMYLCIRLRRHSSLGSTAREVLQKAESRAVERALDQTLSREVPTIAVARSTSTGDLLARYERGEYEAVWRDVRALGPVAGDLRDEVAAVATATMRRVLRNIEIVARRLAADGWTSLNARHLHVPPTQLRTAPTERDATSIARIEHETGAPVPLALRAFWTIVGGVDFVWDYEIDRKPPTLGVKLPLYECDPLSITPAHLSDYRLDEWLEEQTEHHAEIRHPLSIELAPDYLHKANISGGAPYSISVPSPALDPIFENELHQLPFTDYLRLCFRWGGFPTLESYDNRSDVKDFVKRMTHDLIPF